jgi:peptide-methionine (R)-S-oxide reductase
MGYPRLVFFLSALVCIVFVAVGTSTSPEPSFTKHFEVGSYRCRRCSAPVFESDDKFDSGTRWPSFRRAVNGAVRSRLDTSEGLRRTEILCASCGAHLGHVFPDGRVSGDTHPNAGDRYCVLSASLVFAPLQNTTERVRDAGDLITCER